MLDLNVVFEMTWKMLLAVALGGLIGYEREIHGRPAGLRTHILVCFGAALFTIVSEQLAGIKYDPGRVAAQVVSGIGFLGAGTIIRQGSIIRGLTTAASLWTVAAIGMAVSVGGDTTVVAVIATVIVFATLGVIQQIEHRLITQGRYRDLVITIEDDRAKLAPVLSTITEQGVTVQGLEEEFKQEDTVVFRLRLRFPTNIDSSVLNEKLSAMKAVRGIQWM